MSDALPIKLMCQVETGMEAQVKGVRVAELSIADLSARIANGSEEAFEEFYSLYTRRVYALLFSLTGGDGHLTRELHQVVFIRAARRFPRVESEGKLWSWLCAVARHALLDHLKRNSRRSQREQICCGVVSEVSTAETAMLARLEAALEELPAEERELLDQFYFAEESQEMIAEKRGTTIKAIQSKLARVRLKLRSRLMGRSDQV